MPLRSLSSSVFKWPDRDTVDRAVRRWAERTAAEHPGLRRLGYFGSCARGDWGVGSDVDLIAVVGHDPGPFERRALAWNLDDLPVQAEIVVYTEAELRRMEAEGSRFAEMITSSAVWVYPAGPETGR